MNTMKMPLTNRQLAKIATFGAVFVGGNAVLMTYLIGKRFHESGYFVNAAKIVMSNKSLVKYLGEPISFGNPNLSDTTTNFSTEEYAHFEVPVKGSNTKGFIKFSAIRMQTEAPLPPKDSKENESLSASSFWKITNLEVTVDDRPNEKVVLVKEAQ